MSILFFCFLHRIIVTRKELKLYHLTNVSSVPTLIQSNTPLLAVEEKNYISNLLFPGLTNAKEPRSPFLIEGVVNGKSET